ncbi:MAG: hypothetical protein ON057_001758 [Glomeribacter sp. 1016415]|nr:hypothetical protein [Glomeribacter sp. 1016415]
MTHEINAPLDRVIWRRDLQQKLNVHSNTVSVWIKEGRLPKPDVNLSNRTKGWKLSTLRAAEVNFE